MGGDYRSNFTGDQISLAIRKALDFDPDRIPVIAILNDASTPYDINNLIEPSRYTINYVINGTGLMEQVHPIDFDVYELGGLIYQQTTIKEETYYRTYDPNTKEFSEWFTFSMGNTVPSNSESDPVHIDELSDLGHYTVNYLTGIPADIEGYMPYDIFVFTDGKTKYQLVDTGEKSYIREYTEDGWSEWREFLSQDYLDKLLGSLAPKDHTHSADQIMSVNASAIQGVIKLENLPSGALDRLVTVNTKEDRLALTIDDVQNGDSVKQLYKDPDDPNSVDEQLYLVVNDTLLGSDEAFSKYTTGAATSVPWSGVTDTPDTLEGYGIKDRYMMYAEDDQGVPINPIGIDAKTLNGKTAQEIINEAKVPQSILLTDENGVVWTLKIRNNHLQVERA